MLSQATICLVQECERSPEKRGWCGMHYRRWQRHGTTATPQRPKIRKPEEERFWAKVERDGPIPDHLPELGECWIWTASTNAGGYGTMKFRGRSELAHRIAWVLEHGPIPGDLHVLHKCDNPPCVRDEHHFLGTPADNVLDMIEKERIKGSPAANSFKTHCPEGHPYDRVAADGGRACRRCAAAATRRYRARLAASSS